jgi:hypothetical protein
MPKLLPSRLVAVRHYSYTPDLRIVGNDDQRLLTGAGVEAYVKFVGGRAGGSIALVVPEGQVEAAKKVLEGTPELFPADKHVGACPRCGARNPDARPPYVLFVLVVGFSGAGAAIAFRYSQTSMLTVLLTAVIATILQFSVPHWKCRACGELYGVGGDGDIPHDS